jgi:hypothetical protein
MRKLILIAAMLALPAMAFATDITSNQVVVHHDWEQVDGWLLTSTSGLTVQQQSAAGMNVDGHLYGGDGANPIIMDPTGAGRGQVCSWKDLGTARYKLFIDRMDGGAYKGDYSQYPYTHSAGGITTVSADLYLTTEPDPFHPGDPGHFTNVVWDGAQPTSNYYIDGGVISGSEQFLGFKAHDPWIWPDQYTNPDFEYYTDGPLFLDEWFNVTMVIDFGAQTSDLYVNGSYACPIDFDWPEDNGIWWAYDVFDQFGGGLDEGVYMLLDEVDWRYEIPEPSILAIGGIGLLALLRRRKK